MCAVRNPGDLSIATFFDNAQSFRLPVFRVTGVRPQMLHVSAGVRTCLCWLLHEAGVGAAAPSHLVQSRAAPEVFQVLSCPEEWQPWACLGQKINVSCPPA